MDIDIRNDVCKEGLLTVLSKYLRYAERNQIDLSKDNTAFGETYRELVARYNRCRYSNTEKEFEATEELVVKAKSQLAYYMEYSRIIDDWDC